MPLSAAENADYLLENYDKISHSFCVKFYVILDLVLFLIHVIHLRTLKPVGISMIMVDEVKYAHVSTFIRTVNI
jgi:hypothetical protein